MVAKALSRSISEDDPSGLANVKADQLQLWSTDETVIEDPTAIEWIRLRDNDKVEKSGLVNGSIVGVSRVDADGKASRPNIILAEVEDDA